MTLGTVMFTAVTVMAGLEAKRTNEMRIKQSMKSSHQFSSGQQPSTSEPILPRSFYGRIAKEVYKHTMTSQQATSDSPTKEKHPEGTAVGGMLAEGTEVESRDRKQIGEGDAVSRGWSWSRVGDWVFGKKEMGREWNEFRFNFV